MKILFIGMGSFETQRGGLNRYLGEMISALEGSLVDYRHAYIGSMTNNHKDVVLGTNHLRRILTTRRILKEVVDDLKPDIVNIHFALSAFPAMGLFAGTTTIMNFQGPWFREGLVEEPGQWGVVKSAIKKVIENYVYRRVDRFIVLSGEFSRELQDTFNIPEDKISVIPPMVDILKFDVDRCGSQPKSGGPIKLVTVRRLVRRTGVDLLLHALALIKNDPNQASLHFDLQIVGSGPYSKSLKKLIEDLELSDSVTLCGFVNDEELVVKYREADFSIMPTVALEGFGLSTIESFACGTPVIGTPSSANIEAIGGFSVDLLSDEISPQSLSAKLLLCRSANFSAAECRKYAVDNFSADVFAKRITELFESAIRG